VRHVVHMGEERGVHRCWWGKLRERGHWVDPDVDGRMDLQEVRGGCGKWIDLAQDRDR
jgi:hypothetical protein